MDCSDHPEPLRRAGSRSKPNTGTDARYIGWNTRICDRELIGEIDEALRSSTG
jgi:hypothetical protein